MSNAAPFLYFPGGRGASAVTSVETLAELEAYGRPDQLSGQLFVARDVGLLYVYWNPSAEPVSPPEVVDAPASIGGQYVAIGGKGGAFDVLVPFTFDSISPLPLALLTLASGFVERVDVVVTETFDDALASVSVGTVTDPNAIFAPGDVDVTTVDQYTSLDVLSNQPAGTAVDLFITPAGSTQGAGYVHVVGRGG